MWQDEKLEEILSSIFKNQLVIWGQHGSGKTYLLKGLQQRIANSFYVHIHSFRLPLGELYYSILATDWQRAMQIDGRSWATFCRYLPKDDLPSNIEVKPTYFVDTASLNRDVLLSTLTLLDAFNIKALLLDNLDPVEIDDTVKYLLKQLPKENVTVVTASTYQKALMDLSYPIVTIRSSSNPQDDALRQYMEVFHLDDKQAQELLRKSNGNLFNAKLLLDTSAESIQEVVEKEKQARGVIFKGLGYISTMPDLWFSPISKKLVEEHLLGGEYSLTESPLIMEEQPQYRFRSPEIKILVKQNSELSQKEVSHWWAIEFSKLDRPSYWLRVSYLFEQTGEKKHQAFALLMASRYELDYVKRAKILERVLKLFPNLDGARRELIDIYYSQGQFKQSLEMSEQLRNPSLFDTAHRVRLYTLVDRIDEASALCESLLQQLEESIDPFYWPGMLSDLAVYLINIKQEPMLLYDYYVKLASNHIRAPQMHWGAFLNAVGVALDGARKYEDAIEFYDEALKTLSSTGSFEIYSRPLINKVALKAITQGAKTILESKELLENTVQSLSTISQQGFWETLLNNLEEFMTRDAIQKYVKELEESTRTVSSSSYRFIGYMNLAWHYINVLDFNLAEWFLILASKNAFTDVEKLDSQILLTYLRIVEGKEIAPSQIEDLVQHALMLVPKGVDVVPLVAILLMTRAPSIPEELLSQLDSSPYQEALKALASGKGGCNQKGSSCDNVFSKMLVLWRRWERLSMSKLGLVIFRHANDKADPTILKTLADWILHEVRALDYPQLTAYWESVYGNILAPSSWGSFLSWHTNLQEITNVEQLEGALSYILQSFFGSDFFAKFESGTLNLEVGDRRISGKSPQFMEKGSVVHVKVWYNTAPPIAGPAMEFLSYSLEQLISKLFGMQDPLTGLFNRNYSNQRLKEEWELYLRGGPNFSILFMDLDNFKEINDQYSHEMGDKVLIEFANLLRSVLRATDAAIRWGGDEFLVVLPDTDSSEANIIAQRISNQMLNTMSSIGRPVTASIGFACSSETNSLEEMVNLADQRSYMQKAQKGDRIRRL